MIGIPDELPGPVERYVAAALHLEQLHAVRREIRRRRDEVRAFGGPPQGHHGRVLDQEQHVLGDLAADAATRDVTLQLERRTRRAGYRDRRPVARSRGSIRSHAQA